MREGSPVISASLMIAVLIVGLFSGSVLLFFLTLGLMALIVEGDSDESNPVWIFSGVAMYLFASWSWMASLTQAIIGMAVFLLPWVLSTPKETNATGMNRVLSTRRQNMFVRSIPWFGAMGYLGLTWMLLTAEIDGTSLEAHEVFGAPFIAALAIGLMVYSWGIKSNGRIGLFVIFGAMLIAITSGLLSEAIDLPGDPESYLTDEISRGQVAGFLLALILFSIPPSILSLIHI